MNSIKKCIVQFLEEDGGFVWGGVLARAIHDLTGHKEAIVERRARELVREEVLEATYEQVEGKGPKCVKYKVIPFHPNPEIAYNKELRQAELL